MKALLASKGVDVEKIKRFICSDRGRNDEPCDCYFVLTDEEAVILSVREELKEAPHGVLFRLLPRRRSEPVLTQDDWAWFGKDELKKFFTEDSVNGGRFCAEKSDGGAECLFCYTMAKKNEAQDLCHELSAPDGMKKRPLKKPGDDEELFCPKCRMKYPDPETKQCPRCMPRTRLFKRLLPFFKKYRVGIAVTVIFIALGIGIGLIVPYLSNRVLYDRVLEPTGDLYGMIGPLVLAIMLAGIIAAVFDHINSVVSSKISARVVYDLKKTIFENLQRLSMSFFSGRQTGSLMTQVNGDAETLYWFFCDGVPYLITNLIKLLAVFFVMLSIDWRLTALVFVPMPLLAILYRLIMKSFSRLHSKSFARSRRFNSAVSDVLTGFRVVKAFSREDAEIERFDNESRSYSEANLAVALRSNTVFPLINLSISFATLVIWAVGGWLVVQNSVSLGQSGITYASLMLFLSIISYVSGPITFLGEFSGQLARAVNSMRRLFEVMDTVPEVKEKQDPVVRNALDGDIVFDHVGFSYEPGRKVLEDVCFEVKKGQTLGIVGHTGAGKSTLANLMTRLYDPTEGRITLDGEDLKNYSLDTLHSSVAIVSQETYLFRGSIFENIRYACPEATRGEVIEAAKAAGAHDFIMKLANGYNTVVDSSKNNLSGGERQRVSIARAILRSPNILILDEATASMDTQTERQIQDSLDRLTRGRTTVIIAHRLSTLRNADSLVVIKDGKVAEAGTHNELMKLAGEYYKLYMLQLEALKVVAIG
ncbi:MAG: ABC transporter ATP-binding protein [Clostridia bacterium]|nr:ABC transporter ATP-binding protein [Clostridia bacterium]